MSLALIRVHFQFIEHWQIAAGSLDPDHRADLTNTSPIADIGPFPQWFGEDKIVSLDPFLGIRWLRVLATAQSRYRYSPHDCCDKSPDESTRNSISDEGR